MNIITEPANDTGNHDLRRFPRMLISVIAVILQLSSILNAAGYFRYAVITDSHVGTRIGSRDLITVVKDINSLDTLPDFVLVTGDLTEYDLSNELDSAKMILDALRVPYYAIPGNHELKWSSSAGEKFRSLFGDDRFSFSHMGYRFIGFHQGPVLRMGEGFVSPRDIKFLQVQLQNARRANETVVLAMHYPLNESVTDLKEILENLEGFPILHTVHGHGHRNRVSDYSGITGVMVRSSLAQPDKAGYTLVSFDSDDSLRFREKNPGFPVGPPWFTMSSTADAYSVPDSLPGAAGEPLTESSVWSFDTGSMITSEAAVAGNFVYTVTSEGGLFCIDADDGSPVWSRQTGSHMYGAPAISGKYIVAASSDSSMHCFRKKDGREVWHYKTGNALVSTPLIHRGKVYFSSGDGNFYALKLRNGKLIWKQTGSEAYGESRPLIVKDRVLFTAWDQKLTALVLKTGRHIWTWRDGRPGMLYSPAAVSPVNYEGAVYIVAPDRALSCIDIDSGRTLWRSDRFAVRENLALDERSGSLFMKTMFDTVIAVNADTADFDLKWAVSGGYDFDINPAPVTVDNKIIYGTTHFGHLLIMEKETGDLIEDIRLSENLIHRGVLTDDHIVFTTMDGRIIALKRMEWH